jgi:hypothetical protein
MRYLLRLEGSSKRILEASSASAFLTTVLIFTLLACAPSQRLTEQQRLEVFQFVWEEA